MKKLVFNLPIFLLILFAQVTYAQLDFVCLEIDNGLENSIIGVSANALEATQVALAENGFDSEVVECEEDFDFDFPDVEEPTEEDWGYDFSTDDFPFDFGVEIEYLCLEITTESGESSIIGIGSNSSNIENVLQETQASLAAEGITSQVVECEETPDFDFDFPEIEEPTQDDWEWDFSTDDFPTDFTGEIEYLCLEITTENGESSIIGIGSNPSNIENVLQETQDNLAAEGITSQVVECEETPDFDFDFPEIEEPTQDDWEWDFSTDDFPFDDLGEWDDFDAELICLEITNRIETSIISLTENILEETQAALSAQGYFSQVVECEEEPSTIFTPYSNTPLIAEYVVPNRGTSGINPPSNTVKENFIKFGVESLDANINNVDVYPNPANNQNVININFDSYDEEVITVRVMNQLGQQATEIKLTSNKGTNTVSLDSFDLTPGLYFISLSNGKNTNITERLLITK